MDQTAARTRRERLARARLYLVLEPEAAHVLPAALASGVDVVQLRDKHAPDDEIVKAGHVFRRACDEHGALLIVNDRADLALACGADGVHVGQDDEPVERVRKTVGLELLVGVSTHSPPQVDAVRESSADYLGVGPVFATATKPEYAPVGLELVRYAAANAAKPFFAIGGIEPANAARVVRAGAERIAVVRAIRDASHPGAAAASLRRVLERESVGAR